jgi:hypothetical protein
MIPKGKKVLKNDETNRYEYAKSCNFHIVFGFGLRPYFGAMNENIGSMRKAKAFEVKVSHGKRIDSPSTALADRLLLRATDDLKLSKGGMLHDIVDPHGWQGVDYLDIFFVNVFGGCIFVIHKC